MLEENIKLRDNEKILFIIRPSLKVYFFKIILFYLLVLTPSFFWHFLFQQGIYGYLIIFSSLLIALLYLIQILIIYYYNIYIITDVRIIGIDQKGFFRRLIMEIKIKNFSNMEFFKEKSLKLELKDGRSLIIENIEDRDYVYEILEEIINFNKYSANEIKFVKKKIC